MKDTLIKLKENFNNELATVKDENTLRSLEIKYLGRKGELSSLLKGIAGLEQEQKRELGTLANEIKHELADAVGKAREGFGAGKSAEFIDPTLPAGAGRTGHLHPITRIQNELEEIFRSLGFMVLEGPEMESDFFNFEALNIPAHHPARDTQDTFYVDRAGKDYGSEIVMRTHTSPMQVRAMIKYGAPLRCVVPGRVFRAEATDAVHEHTFYQLEGLMIDRNISIANLIAVMRELIKGVFGREVETRIRPGYFPFVEPGIELDIKCTICGGTGCPSCKHSGWLELLPAGMVHPKVLEYGRINPDEYSGFAFGLGMTRLAMMKYGIGDIRLFNSGDLRFLEQF